MARKTRLTCLFLAIVGAVTPGTATPGASDTTNPGCGRHDRPEPALQGQVPVSERLNGSAANGYRCNLELVGEYASRSFANFDTYRNCAYYTDNTGFLPGSEGGGVVLDVSDPRHPVRTAYLLERAMGNGGETLRVNQARGLLVASYYNLVGPAQIARRWLAVYSVVADCAHPRLMADVELPSAVGHEGCFQPDGMVYYMADGGATITPIDLTDPTHPKQLSDPWPLRVHGCSISDDGTRGYFASVYDAQMFIVDTSQVQSRVPGAGYEVIATFPTPDVQVQQATVPLYYGERSYVVQWSEAKYNPKACVPGQANFGYPRIIDVTDEKHPLEIAKIQTEVVLPENCAKVAGDSTVQTGGLSQGDPGYAGVSLIFGYDSHMCTPDRLHEPTILACSQLGSGLRVYDIRDPHSPHEIAYYNTGTVSRDDPTLDWAFARPVVRSDLGEIWWVTNLEGFHVARFARGVWPFPGDAACPVGYDYFRAQYDLRYAACKQERKTADATSGGSSLPRPARAERFAFERSIEPVVESREAALRLLLSCHVASPS